MKPSAADLDALARRDPSLGKVMRELSPFPGFPVDPPLPHFHALSRIIIYQQLAATAAKTIHGRVQALSPRHSRFPTASELLAIPEERLREAGLSRNKLRALRELAGRIQDGELRLRDLSRHSNEEVIGRLTDVWGIGEWSAQMFLLFHLGRLDVFAPKDLGIQEGIRILDGLDQRPDPPAARARSAVWKPLRSVASWYLWRLAEAGGV